MVERPVVHIVDDDIELAASIAQVVRLVKLDAITYPSANDFLSKYQPGQPGCLVTDIRMPGMSGPELQEHLDAKGDLLPVIIISGCADVSTAVRAMKAGAREVFEKGGSMHSLLEAIQKAVQEDVERRGAESEYSDTRLRFDGLSPREREVLFNMLEGKTNKAIAQVLGISANTVEIHRARVMEKMGAESLASLVKACVYAGLDKKSKNLEKTS